MLQEFRVDNFKSLINVVFKPREINLLIGRNNSGKTNLCQALRFVSGSSFTTFDACADWPRSGGSASPISHSTRIPWTSTSGPTLSMKKKG